LRSRWKRSDVRLVILASGEGALVAVAVPLAVAGGARSSARAAPRGANPCGATVKVHEQVKFVINRYLEDGMRFVPGTVTVKSGCPLTFEFATPGESDPHSLSIVKESDLPKTTAQMENCKICGQIGAKHVKHPGTPPGPTNPIVHWIVNAGKPGLDVPGDSISILEAKGAPQGHSRLTVLVSAPAGRILYFMCGMHAWMQGKIVVE
jgi:plastocyanin